MRAASVCSGQANLASPFGGDSSPCCQRRGARDPDAPGKRGRSCELVPRRKGHPLGGDAGKAPSRGTLAMRAGASGRGGDMSRSGQGAGRPPLANIDAARSSRSAAQPGDSGFDAHAGAGAGRAGHGGSCAAKPPLLMRRMAVKPRDRAGGAEEGSRATTTRSAPWQAPAGLRINGKSSAWSGKAKRQGRDGQGLRARMGRSRTRRGLAGAGPQN